MPMTCEEVGVLLHALIDGELDAGHAREVEAHATGCPRCAAALRNYREMRQAMAGANLAFKAPDALRRRIEAAIPAGGAQTARTPAPTRRSLLQGFALGTALSAAAAASVVFVVVRSDRDERILGDVVSAHLRSLQAEHLTDVPSSNQHTVKPWFNGRLDVAPPVVDLTAQGFTLLGGRLDYIDGKAVAAVVYRRRIHVINLFVSQSSGVERSTLHSDMVQGFNIRRWTDQGLRFIAISDIGADELQEFAEKYEAGLHTSS
jgi:anti-sigma factor RsiW